jgi:hypothetical protein
MKSLERTRRLLSDMTPSSNGTVLSLEQARNAIRESKNAMYNPKIQSSTSPDSKLRIPAAESLKINTGVSLNDLTLIMIAF